MYVKQPIGFEHADITYHVLKLDKTIYGLKQAPIAWYDKIFLKFRGKEFLIV